MIKFPIKLFYNSILPSSILYLAILYFSNIHNIKLSLVIRDLAQTCGYPIGVGMISNIGILLWGAAAPHNKIPIFEIIPTPIGYPQVWARSRITRLSLMLWILEKYKIARYKIEEGNIEL